MRRTADSQRGFTLVEIIVSIVALGILMALVISVFSPEVKRGTDTLYSMRAAELGQSLLEQMLGKRYDQNSPPGNALRCNAPGQPSCSATLGPENGETTYDTFDDFDDYNGLTNVSPIDQNGNVLTSYAGFKISATVVYAGSEVGLPHNTDAKRVDLTITDPAGNKYVFSAYKTNF